MESHNKASQSNNSHAPGRQLLSGLCGISAGTLAGESAALLGKGGKDLMLTQEHLDAPLRFASENGYLATWIDPKIEADFVKLLIDSDFYYVAIGPSHGGDWGHSIVMHKGKAVHDPDPPAEFLAGDPWLLFLIG